MIIALPANEKKENTNICMSYGRCPFYMLYNTETKVTSFIENTAANDAGGAGIKASQSLVDKNVNIVLTQRCGENAAKVLNEASIKIYKTIHEQAIENIKSFEKNELKLLTTIHPGFHSNNQNGND